VQVKGGAQPGQPGTDDRNGSIVELHG
jgi:hypothetical protein